MVNRAGNLIRNSRKLAYRENPRSCMEEDEPFCRTVVTMMDCSPVFLLVSFKEISMKRVAIYIRVSTSKQDTDNQRRELEAVAKRAGRQVVKLYEEAGISGAKGRDQRPGLDAMRKAGNAKEVGRVERGSVDRLECAS